MTPTLLIASGNIGKLREIRAILAGFPIHLALPTHIGVRLEVDEHGSTYAENAALKAIAYAKASGLVSLADDSGLEVDALGGSPGLHSARYVPLTDATDADRRKYLIKNLESKLRPWTARFHCTVAIATPDGSVEFADGDCVGEIIPQERGEGGFGYDPIFFLPQLGLTMAELPMEVKNQLSHRAKAVHAALPALERLFQYR